MAAPAHPCARGIPFILNINESCQAIPPPQRPSLVKHLLNQLMTFPALKAMQNNEVEFTYLTGIQVKIIIGQDQGFPKCFQE